LLTEEDLLAHIGSRRYRPSSTAEIAERFAIPPAAVAELDVILRDLQVEGEIVELPGRGWVRAEGSDHLAGTLRMARRGFGFVVPARRDREGDLFIGADAIGDAFDGDVVLARIRRAGAPGTREGAVVRVLRRRRSAVRGSFFPAGERGGFVQPDERYGSQEIWIPPGAEGEAGDEDRVLVRLEDGPGWGVHPRGRVVHVLGPQGTLRHDLELVRCEFDLPGPFPEGAKRDAAAAAARPLDLGGRRDLRGEMIFTIDPADAQDFDDAVSLSRAADGTWLLGIHIADVAWFVPSGGAVDREARERGTSIYLPGATIHMIPEAISCGVASLQPDEDRLTKSVRIRVAPGGEVLGWEIFPSIIRSRRRFTYEEVQGILDLAGRGFDVPAPVADLAPIILEMQRLMEVLRRKRRERGALELEIPKLRLDVDGAGDVIGVGAEERLDSHRIIEEFMLLANEVVALEAGAKGLPIPCRIHPEPDPKGLREFFFFLKLAGVSKGRGGPPSRDLQEILDLVRGEPYARAVNVALLRSLARAVYAPGPGLHYALATSSYCHFTSPIRRYPDLVVHQVLSQHFAGLLSPSRGIPEWREAMPAIARHASEMEERAEEAEEAMTRLRLSRYLVPRIGEEMDGVVIAVGPQGLTVQIEDTMIEGRIHIATLAGDVYEYDAQTMRVAGRRRRRSFRPGDRIPVRLTAVDPEAREIDFEWIAKQ